MRGIHELLLPGPEGERTPQQTGWRTPCTGGGLAPEARKGDGPPSALLRPARRQRPVPSRPTPPRTAARCSPQPDPAPQLSSAHLPGRAQRACDPGPAAATPTLTGHAPPGTAAREARMRRLPASLTPPPALGWRPGRGRGVAGVPGSRHGWRSGRQRASGRNGRSLLRFPPSARVLRKSLQRGVVLSAGSFLVYEAHKLISGFAEVHASFKVEEVIEQADYLYGSGETEKLYRLLVQHKNSDDAELLWRLARASRDLAQLSSTSAEQRKQLAYEALEYTKKALEKNESNFAAHKWYGICLSDVGDFEGIKTKIGNAFIIKEHFERAVELNPKDATTIHLIGIWCYSFAEMPWYQRKIAATLFATPPTSTFEEALRYFHMAEEADPNFYSKNLLYLGKTYLKLNNKKLALLWLSKAKDYPAHTEEDKQVQKEALELLNSI
ncbi:regulator of microtubule dynamics protein 1 isoform X2 [Columba livia]|uniref:regulator of microtubule dynamics protein 1 isoform X2 n=1 Tax=Columba livia TaxID=8932 RepID=UPI0031BAE940